MNELDIYYRALLDLRSLTAQNRACATINSAITEADTENDNIVVTRAKCTVDKDWIMAIEEGLVHIEKAIKEERQFIRSNGEVIPIEKVKSVSKESVQHLARHSNLITKVPEDENEIIPEKLFAVERLNDYTVYENRFLYMLLCYLRDFITIRYNKILDITNKYEGSLDLNKTVTVAKRTMSYTVTLKEERRDDSYLRANNSARSLIDRMDLILKAVLAFLATPLMEAASKVAMLKPPITKTNVLKMDNNFKGAVRLYEFIVAYDKPGFTIEYETNEISPFRDELAAEIAECGALMSFLTYEYGLGIKLELKERYLEEEERRKTAELMKKSEQLEALARRLKSSGVSPEEYILSLEKQLRSLTAECEKIEPLRNEIDELRETVAKQKNTIEDLGIKIDELNELIEEERRLHAEEIARLKEEHAREIEELKEAHKKEIEELKAEHERIVKELRESYELKITELKEEHRKVVAELNEKHAKVVEDMRAEHARRMDEVREAHEKEVTSLREAHEKALDTINQAHDAKIEALNSEHERAITAERELRESETEKLRTELENTSNTLTEQLDTSRTEAGKAKDELAAKCDECTRLTDSLTLAEAQIKGLRAELGKMSGNFTDKASFDQLEREYEAFTRFYKAEWAKTKKQIRKNLLNIENFKGKKDDKDGLG